jgi:hypothetical protein
VLLFSKQGWEKNQQPRNTRKTSEKKHKNEAPVCRGRFRIVDIRLSAFGVRGIDCIFVPSRNDAVRLVRFAGTGSQE